MTERQNNALRIARLAVAERMVTPETAERLLRLVEDRKIGMPFDDMLLEFGHINGEQFNRLVSLEHAAARREPSREDQELFGQTVVGRGLATSEQVGHGLKEQAELSARGVFKNLGEILVERGLVTPGQVKSLIEEQNQMILLCPSCGDRYNVLREWVGRAQCPIDSAVLKKASPDAQVGIVATLDGPSQAVESMIGREVGGCRIVEMIARGSRGSVYKAKHIGLNRYVAIKMLPANVPGPVPIKRLLFEARTIAKIEHPNIVQVYDAGFQNDGFFIVMQLLKGRTLEDRLAGNGALPSPEALTIARDVAHGLAAAHEKGIIHRDLKPSNIVLSEEGRARLTDFGLAQDMESSEKVAGFIVGTPYTMSPEQWLGHRADERSDLYSLGVILYQMVTGRRPFEGESVNDLMHQHLKVAPHPPRAYNEAISEGLCAMIRKMLAKAPAKRYPDVPDFLKDLRRVMAGEEPDALAEFGTLVKCEFCETPNPAGEPACVVCNEPLHGAGAPIEIASRSAEFKCPGCGEAARRGTTACPKCGKLFCSICRHRIAVLRGFCAYCMSQG